MNVECRICNVELVALRAINNEGLRIINIGN